MIETFDSIRALAKVEAERDELFKENARLKALIHNGVSVKVFPTETKLYDEIKVWYGEGANGTLILQNKWEI